MPVACRVALRCILSRDGAVRTRRSSRKQAKLSWVFKRSTYTYDPVTGARVGQYARKDAVEPLDDQRLVTSSYRRTRTVNNGRDGSMDTSYQVQAWATAAASWCSMADVQRRLEGIDP